MKKLKRQYKSDCPFIQCVTSRGKANLMQIYYEQTGKSLAVPSDSDKPITMGDMVESTEEIQREMKKRPKPVRVK